MRDDADELSHRTSHRMGNNQSITTLGSIDNLKIALQKEYTKHLNNYFGNEQKALKFLTNVIADVQRKPDLLRCEATTVINAYMMIASLGFMPSGVNGQAYVLPFNDKGIAKAQFILGYKGIVALMFRSPVVKDILCERVREKDEFDYTNGIVTHRFDPFSKERGEVIGAYAIVRLRTGGQASKVMGIDEILKIAETYSKSYKTAFSSWKNDPDGWMVKKTVLRQAAKLVPMDDTYADAIAREDRDDSTIEDTDAQKRLGESEPAASSLTMGALAEAAAAESSDSREGDDDGK